MCIWECSKAQPWQDCGKNGSLLYRQNNLALVFFNINFAHDRWLSSQRMLKCPMRTYCSWKVQKLNHCQHIWFYVIFVFVEYPNLYVHHLNYTDIISRSPQAHILEQIWEKGTINVHISDLMRPRILSMHGGAYMDSDTISLKPFPRDIHNFLVEGVVLVYDKTKWVFIYSST